MFAVAADPSIKDLKNGFRKLDLFYLHWEKTKRKKN